MFKSRCTVAPIVKRNRNAFRQQHSHLIDSKCRLHGRPRALLHRHWRRHTAIGCSRCKCSALIRINPAQGRCVERECRRRFVRPHELPRGLPNGLFICRKSVAPDSIDSCPAHAATDFDQLVQSAAALPQPQRLLFVLARARLPVDATPAQRERFVAGGGNTLSLVVCVDKGLDELSSFEALVTEARAAKGSRDGQDSRDARLA